MGLRQELRSYKSKKMWNIGRWKIHETRIPPPNGGEGNGMVCWKGGRGFIILNKDVSSGEMGEEHRGLFLYEDDKKLGKPKDVRLSIRNSVSRRAKKYKRLDGTGSKLAKI